MLDVSKRKLFIDKFKSFMWPIKREELAKIIPMMLIIFLIAFTYHILKDIKDTLVITAKSSGAEVIPFLKVWAILPSAVICVSIFNKLFNTYNREKVVVIITSAFLLFFVTFIMVLYPNKEALHLDGIADFLETVLPLGWRGFSMMIRYWSFSMFYVASEMWGVLLLSLLFWGFANDITKFDEAKRYYPLLSLSANASGIFSGFISYILSRKVTVLFWGQDHWEQSMRLLIFLSLFCGVAILFLFHKLIVNYDNGPKCTLKKKIKLSLKENLISISKSKHLLCIVVIVLSYNITNNLLEVLWKNQVRELHPTPNDYNAYINQVTMWIGIVSTSMALCMSAWFKRFGWSFVALITPRVIMITALLFIPLIIFKEHLPAGFLGIIVLIGSIQNVFMRSSKFTVSDASKEMAFIPLSVEQRRRGKSAIDGIGSRFGKSAGSVIYQILLVIFGSISACTPYIGILLLGLIIPSYLKSTKTLGKKIDGITTLQHVKERY